MTAENEPDWQQLRQTAMVAARRAGAGEWAEEIANEAMLRLLVGLDSVAEPGAWVTVVARRLAIDHHRGQPPGGWTELPVSTPGPGQRAHPDHLRMVGPSEQVGREDLLARALAVVNDVEQELLIGQSHGYSTRELAEMHNYTERSVRTKLSVARRKIREAFPDEAARAFE